MFLMSTIINSQTLFKFQNIILLYPLSIDYGCDSCFDQLSFSSFETELTKTIIFFNHITVLINFRLQNFVLV